MKDKKKSNTLPVSDYYVKLLSREETVSVYRQLAPLHFPEDELKPVSAIEALFDQNAYLGLGLYLQSDNSGMAEEDHPLLGYALFLTIPKLDTVLLDYYAILEQYRDLGLGSIFLQELKNHFKDYHGIFIETEAPDSATDEEERLLRNRRNAFYYKNGAHRTDIACTLFGVPFNILFLTCHDEPSQPRKSSPQEQQESCTHAQPQEPSLRDKLDAIYRFMLPETSYAQNLLWR